MKSKFNFGLKRVRVVAFCAFNSKICMVYPHMTVHRVIFWSFVLTLFTLICLIWKKFGGNWLQYNVCPSWTWMLVNSKCITNLFLFKGKARIIHVESKREHKYVPVSLNMSEIIGSSKYAQSDSCTKMKTLRGKASFLRRGCLTIYSQNTGIA